MTEHKVNLQARIKRHSRILKDNLWNSLHNSKNKTLWFKVVSILIILIFPIYPVFSYFGTTAESFYRWDIDESSILESYDFWDDPDALPSDTVVESKDSFLSVWALVEDDNSSSNKMIEYIVKKWDKLDSIAKKYNVSKDTIIWANNLDSKKNELKEWTKLIFPPVTWVVYSVKKWDTISGIARKFHVYTKDIIAQNNIKNNYLKISQKLVIPNWKPLKEEEKKIVKKTYEKKPYYKKSYKKITKTYNKKLIKSYISRANIIKGLYPLKWRKPFSGAWWNCTYYVASYKNVKWRWNANQWLRNARAKWVPTWNYAVNWAIVVLWGRWYNRWYGHVAIVRKVEKNYLIVSDMNYRRLNQVTIRKIKRYWSHIKWYIYAWD